MILSTPRLILRAFSAADLSGFLAYRSDPEVLRYQGMAPMSQEKAITFLDEMKDMDLTWQGKWMQIAIEKRDEQKLIGDLALKTDAYDPRLAEIGYTLHPAYQGQGFATEAVEHLLRHLFSEKNFHRITALVDVRNPPSFQLLEKLGFRREAHYRKSYFDKIDGDWFDEYRYALLGEDWG